MFIRTGAKDNLIRDKWQEIVERYDWLYPEGTWCIENNVAWAGNKCMQYMNIVCGGNKNHLK